MELKQAANKQVPVCGYGGEVQRSVPKDTTKEPSTALATAAQPETSEEARIRFENFIIALAVIKPAFKARNSNAYT